LFIKRSPARQKSTSRIRRRTA